MIVADVAWPTTRLFTVAPPLEKKRKPNLRKAAQNGAPYSTAGRLNLPLYVEGRSQHAGMPCVPPGRGGLQRQGLQGQGGARRGAVRAAPCTGARGPYLDDGRHRRLGGSSGRDGHVGDRVRILVLVLPRTSDLPAASCLSQGSTWTWTRLESSH